MYSERWSPRLRQGDILGPLPLPLLGTQFEVVAPTRSLTSGIETSAGGKIIIDAENVVVAVISHDCEFNDDKRNKLLVARLQNVPGNLDSEQREALRGSNDVAARVEADEAIAGVDSFLLAPLPGRYEQEQVVNFGTITPLPMKMKADLLSVKRAELRHDVRELFRAKLAWFFGRHADDMPDDQKRPADPDQDTASEGTRSTGADADPAAPSA